MPAWVFVLALLVRIGMPALAALVFVAVLVLGMIYWIIASPDRSDRVARILLARQGDARCLEPGTSAPSSPDSKQCRQSVRSGGNTTRASAG